MSDSYTPQRILVTGATGFVGRHVVRELLSRNLTVVCLVRSSDKLKEQHSDFDSDRLVPAVGKLRDTHALAAAAKECNAVIHLVGIIIERKFQGQTFAGVHVQGTEAVVEAAKSSGIRRFVHMSALGARDGAVSTYHRTKWAAEHCVRTSGLTETIFRPSLIHGPSGEFMRLMKQFACGWVPPMIPYFGDGTAKIQPVSVKDVAHCLVEALFREATIGQVYPLGGPVVYEWAQFYEVCRRIIPGAKRWKPIVSQPVAVAKVVAALSAPLMAIGELMVPSLGMFRFDAGQVDMSQEDSICDVAIAESAFDLKMRNFEEELSVYCGMIP